MPPAKTSYFENQREKVEDGKTFCIGVRGRWLSRCDVVLLRRVRTSDVGSWKGTVGVWVRYLRKHQRIPKLSLVVGTHVHWAS